MSRKSVALLSAISLSSTLGCHVQDHHPLLAHDNPVQVTFVDKSHHGDPNPPHLGVITYYWNQLNVGDCHQKNGTLIMRSDGTATFTADMWTSHTTSGDVWHSDFWVLNGQGNHYVMFGPSSGPSSWGSTVQLNFGFRWNADNFESLPRAPETLIRITQESGC